METKKVPRGALRIVETGEGSTALTEFFGEEGKEKPRLNMTAYSGGVIKDHWYWNDLILDLEGVSFEKKFPILENHETDRKIAFSSNPILENGKLEINPDKTKFVDTEISAEFQRLSAEGFPYQCSVYAEPTVVETLSEDATAEANGITMKGPGTIFRKWEMKEASVCVFGWDSKTQATAFSKEEVEIDMEEVQIEAKQKPILKLKNKDKGGDTMPLVTKLEDVDPKLVEEIQLEMKKEVEIEAAKKETELNKEIADLTLEKDAMTERVLGLEKRDAIRTEKELKATADKIWTEKLSKSDLPESMFDKIRQYVSHVKFTKDEVFDTEAFSVAVDAEIEDWVKRGITSVVLGTGFTKKEADEKELSEEDQKSVDDDVNALRKKVGVDPLKTDE